MRNHDLHPDRKIPIVVSSSEDGDVVIMGSLMSCLGCLWTSVSGTPITVATGESIVHEIAGLP
jgi:hypothetical protein